MSEIWNPAVYETLVRDAGAEAAQRARLAEENKPPAGPSRQDLERAARKAEKLDVDEDRPAARTGGRGRTG